MTGSKLLARFGILADVQYADVCDKPAIYDPSKTRYYRASLDHVVRAFEIWDKEDKKPGFVLQLGDIIDGLNKNTNGLDPSEAMSKTLAAFEAHPTIPTFHAVGNHELYNFKRAEIAQLFRDSLIYRTKVKTDLLGLSLNLDDWSSPGARKDDCSLYYKFNPCPGVKFIALDCFEISVIGYDTSHENYQKAAKILYEHHGHHDYELWDTGESLNSGPEKRFQQQNGAISENQLLWLTEELADSERKGEKVIVFGHVGLHPGSCDTSCLLWNYDEVLKVFHRFNCVVSYMSGHTHTFGHSVDEKGIHYLVYHGVIETSPEEEAFATVCLYEDHIFVKGYGVEKTLDLGIPSRHSNVLNECVDEILSEELISNDAESATNNCSTVTVSV